MVIRALLTFAVFVLLAWSVFRYVIMPMWRKADVLAKEEELKAEQWEAEYVQRVTAQKGFFDRVIDNRKSVNRFKNL